VSEEYTLKAEELERGIDVENTTLVYSLISNGKKEISRTLKYDYTRCNGCGICVSVCPTKALELGSIPEIATGLDAPPVTWNIDLCTFCGMCAAFCPVNAIKMDTNDVDVAGGDSLLNMDTSFNEQCLPCLICERTCPHDAIEVELNLPTKESLFPFDETGKGSIEVDMEKCTLCGICAPFCPAFVMVEKDVDCNSLMPFENLIVDTEKCDYCTLCVDICPEDAISVERISGKPINVKPPKIEGEIKVDAELCTRCGWCAAVCPYDGVDVQRPFDADVHLLKGPLTECDPIGCHACFNVCPSNCFYVKERSDTTDGGVEGIRIGVKEDFCIGCGACENSCPLHGIVVERKQSSHFSPDEGPWGSQWNDAISSLTEGTRHRPDAEGSIDHLKIGVEHNEGTVEAVPKKNLKRLTRPLEEVEQKLKNVGKRRKFELGGS